MEKKEKKPLTKRWWFWVIIVLVVIGVVGAMGGDSTDTAAENNSQSATSQAATSQPQEGAASSEPQEETTPSAGAVGDYNVTLNDATFTTDIDGNPVIVVNYDFMNNSDDSIMPLVATDITAFQDGVSLEIAFVMDDSYDAGIAQREVQPGASLAGCQQAYVLTSTSPVTVQVSPLFGDVALERVFNVQ